MAYDPQLGGVVLFGGIGPSSSNNVLYLLKGGTWSAVTMHPSPKPMARLDPQLVWDPVKQAFMIFGGVQDVSNGTVGLSDTWLVEAPPMSIAPTSGPSGTQVTIDSGPGWPAGTAVTVTFQSTTLTTVTASAGGYVHTTATVPSTKVGLKSFKLANSTLAMMVSQNFTVTHFADAASKDGSRHRHHAHGTGGAGSVPASRTSHYRSTPATATGQITASGGQFWLGSSPILLHGLDASPIVPDMVDSDFALIQSWHMNFLRLRVRWSDFEPVAPVLNGGTWTHTYSTSVMARLKAVIALAAAHGQYVLIENYCGPPCMGSGMGWPSWLYKSGYNSHAKNYTNVQTANTDFWTDSMQQQFVKSWLVWTAGQLQGVPGVAGYEVLNEPAQGSYLDSLATTQMMLNVQLTLAQAVRAADPPRMIFFMTRQSSGAGLPDADLSGWVNLGNVAFDVHDYFGGRWGGGLRVDNPETLQDLYDFTLTPTNPSYLGTTLSQTFFMQTFQNVLTPNGIPLFLGELGGRGEAEANILTLYATMLDGANLQSVSWTAQSYNGNNDLFKVNGDPEPWVPILSAAAQYPG
jgi:aryl-phospho-beta-D-glucosidase BglC (GH1 family)